VNPNTFKGSGFVKEVLEIVIKVAFA